MPGKYRPLRQVNQFRLLELQPGVTDDAIRCQLRIANIPHCQSKDDQKVQYDALSYVWGSGAIKHRIFVDGWLREVGENLWQFLTEIRDVMEPRILWVDKLCIDQSNIEERNQQVQKMSLIYKSAKRTLVWLGTGSREIETTMDFIERFGHGQMLADQANQSLQAMLRWLQLPYWTRTWIVQEFLLAEEVVIMYGNRRSSDKAVLHFLQSISGKSGPKVVDSESILKTPGATILRQRERGLAASRTTLAKLLADNQDSKCFESRDRVYAFLGLASDCSAGNMITVDYGKDIRAVFYDVVRFWTQKATTNSEATLLQLCHLLVKVLDIGQNFPLSRHPRLPPVQSTHSLSRPIKSSELFNIPLLSIGTITRGNELAQIDVSSTLNLSLNDLMRFINEYQRLSSWVESCIPTIELQSMGIQLAHPSAIDRLRQCWKALGRFSLRSHGVLNNGSKSVIGSASNPRSSLTLVGISFSGLKDWSYSIGLAIGSVCDHDIIIQAPGHEIAFAIKSTMTDPELNDSSIINAILVCGRSGEARVNPQTLRPARFATFMTEAECKGPPIYKTLCLTIQELLAVSS